MERGVARGSRAQEHTRGEHAQLPNQTEAGGLITFCDVFHIALVAETLGKSPAA